MAEFEKNVLPNLCTMKIDTLNSTKWYDNGIKTVSSLMNLNVDTILGKEFKISHAL